MAEFIIDNFNITSQKIKWLLRVVFFIIGILPYIVLSFIVSKLWFDNIQVTPSIIHVWWLISIPDNFGILLTLVNVGSWVCWFLFCKMTKFIVEYCETA